jgi:hypothetical protein
MLKDGSRFLQPQSSGYEQAIHEHRLLMKSLNLYAYIAGQCDFYETVREEFSVCIILSAIADRSLRPISLKLYATQSYG